MKLQGEVIVITRARHQAADFIRAVQQCGGVPLLFPTIEIVPPESWEACDRAVENLYMYDGLLFSSANGVHCFFQRLDELGTDRTMLQGKRVFAVGDKTGAEIANHSLTVTAVPEKFTAQHLAAMLGQEDLTGKAFLFPRGNLGENVLADNLKILGASVDSVIVYRTLRPSANELADARARLLAGGVSVITFTSPSTFSNFASFFTPNELDRITGQSLLAAIGPVTASAISKSGYSVAILAEQSTVESLTDAICHHLSQSTRH